MLTTLIGELVAATTPAVDEQSDDPLGALAYPRLTVEVDYVAGIEGGSLFVLTPHDSATLAAVMMGIDAPMGDGLSDIELSAVAEAMSQMMGAAANVLGRGTSAARSRSRRPSARWCPTRPRRAPRSRTPAYASRFQIVSDRITAEVLQLLPADVATSLEAAFAAGGGESGRGAGAHGRGDGVDQCGGGADDGGTARLRLAPRREGARLGRARAAPVCRSRMS